PHPGADHTCEPLAPLDRLTRVPILRLARAVVDGDERAVTGQALGDRPSDAPRSAGDQGRLSAQVAHPVLLSCAGREVGSPLANAQSIESPGSVTPFPRS